MAPSSCPRQPRAFSRRASPYSGDRSIRIAARGSSLDAQGNGPVRSDQLEQIVWDQVRALLEEPHRVADEYRGRMARGA